MKPVRLILVAVALGALTLVPGALANTNGLLTANDPTLGPTALGGTDNATVTVTNTDTVAHIIDSIGLAGADPGQFGQSDVSCVGSLAASAQCTIAVTFTPTTTGAKSAQLVLGIDSASPVDVSDLSGTATAAPAPVVSVNDLNLGNVKVGATKTGTVTLNNTGNAALHIGVVNPGGSVNVINTTNNTCANSTVAAGNSCTIGVSFTPTATLAYSLTLTFNDDAANSPQTATVSGLGVSQYVSFSPQSHGFGKVTVGKLGQTQQFTVKNLDTAAFTINSIVETGNTGAFKLTPGACAGATLAPNATCTFSVRYGATAAGQQNATITFTDTAPDATQTVKVGGTGVSPAAFTGVRGVVGCTTATLQWTVPSGVAGSWIVRNASHAPQNQHDGTRIKATGKGVRQDKKLTQFHTYHYAIWAQYKSAVNGAIVYSAPKRLNLRTGRICTPGRGARLTGTTPLIDWTSVPGAFAYSLRIINHGQNIQVAIKHNTISSYKVPASWRYKNKTRRLQHGQPYQIYVYAYTNKHPKGIGIGSSSFSVK